MLSGQAVSESWDGPAFFPDAAGDNSEGGALFFLQGGVCGRRGVFKLGYSPTSRLQRTAQARFLLRLGQIGAGLAGQIGVKLGQKLPVKWCRVWKLFYDNVFKGRR